MFEKLGKAVAHHPWRASAVWLLLLLIAAGASFWGFGHGGLFERLDNSISLVPGTESDQVNKATTGSGGVRINIVVTGVDVPANIPKLTDFMSVHRTDFSDISTVASVTDPFLFPDPRMPQAQALFSDKEDGFVVVVLLDEWLKSDAAEAAEADVKAAADDFDDALRAKFPDATARIMSTLAMNRSVTDQMSVDLVRGESIGLPVALLLLVIVFGGLLAAGLPIVGALVAIGVGMGVLWALTFATTVESFTINIASIIGLGLSVDYGLLIVSRYREELARVLETAGYPADGSRVPDKAAAKPIVQQAMVGTVQTAGRTVFFSALTIAFALSALLTMKAPMMRIIGAAGLAVTLMALLTAITLVPAIVVIMRRTLIKPSVISRIPGLRSAVRAVGDSASDTGVFSHLARSVHRRPWLVMLLTALILGAMAWPLQELQMRTAFIDYIPDKAASTKAYNTVQNDYPAMKAPTIVVVTDMGPNGTADLVAHLKDLPNVDYVSQPQSLPSVAARSVINVHVDLENQVGKDVTQLVLDLREYDAGYRIQVGGPAALQHDFVQSIIERSPYALAIMVLAVFILMFLMTGSLVVPLKAVIINLSSLLASLGATTYIFMNGVLGMPKVMGMETFIVVCAVAFGFGLAMDYEVFLISRVKEYWDRGLPNDKAVEMGLQRSGRIITSAAAIIVAVFVGFTFGDMIPIKEIGVALAITVITDATIVRMLLVPATMTVLGKWNWWSPKPLRTLYGKWHLVH